MNSQRRPALGGDANHPNAKRINPQRIDEKKMKNLKKLWKMNLLHLSQALSLLDLVVHVLGNVYTILVKSASLDLHLMIL